MESFVEEVEQAFDLHDDIDQLRQWSARLQQEMRHELIHGEACMLPSVHSPCATAMLDLLAVEIGGSNIRIAWVDLQQNPASIAPEVYAVPEKIRACHGFAFLDWIAERMVIALQSIKRQSRPVPVALAWAFPLQQVSPSCSTIISMGKAFACEEDYVGLDPAHLLSRSCLALGLEICVKALVNDTEAALLAAAHFDPSTTVAITLGTGINAAFCTSSGIINTELSMFGGTFLPLTRWDQALSDAHMRPNLQPFEYLTAGRYLGEIVRLVLVEAVERRLIPQCPFFWNLPYCLETLQLTRHMSTDSIGRIIRAVTRRSMALVAVAIHALIQISPSQTVGTDGSLFGRYPGFTDSVQQRLSHLATTPVTLRYIPNATLIGAAASANAASSTLQAT